MKTCSSAPRMTVVPLTATCPKTYPSRVIFSNLMKTARKIRLHRGHLSPFGRLRRGVSLCLRMCQGILSCFLSSLRDNCQYFRTAEQAKAYFRRGQDDPRSRMSLVTPGCPSTESKSAGTSCRAKLHMIKVDSTTSHPSSISSFFEDRAFFEENMTPRIAIILPYTIRASLTSSSVAPKTLIASHPLPLANLNILLLPRHQNGHKAPDPPIFETVANVIYTPSPPHQTSINFDGSSDS